MSATALRVRDGDIKMALRDLREARSLHQRQPHMITAADVAEYQKALDDLLDARLTERNT